MSRGNSDISSLKILWLIWTFSRNKISNKKNFTSHFRKMSSSHWSVRLCAFLALLIVSLRLLNVLVFTVVIPVSSFIGVKIPLEFYAPRCRAVKIDRGYMQDLSSVARSCTYIRSRVSGENTPANPRSVPRKFTNLKFDEELVSFTPACPSRDSLLRVRRSFRSFSLPCRPYFQLPWPILIHQRGTGPLRLLLCAHTERRGLYVAAEMWYNMQQYIMFYNM